MAKNNYYSGIEAGKKMYLESISKHGFNFPHEIAKTRETCFKYGYDMSISKTKKGVPLTSAKRKFYRGIADYLQAPDRIVY